LELIFGVSEGVIKGLFGLAFGFYEDTEELVSCFSEFYMDV
jgi:hypothetical protein